MSKLCTEKFDWIYQSDVTRYIKMKSGKWGMISDLNEAGKEGRDGMESH